jgi:hypothetical protein
MVAEMVGVLFDYQYGTPYKPLWYDLHTIKWNDDKVHLNLGIE